MILFQWAIEHGITIEAIQDLQRRLGTLATEPVIEIPQGISEEAVWAHERLLASREGRAIWRNNVGALRDKGGRTIRYGLCNDSKRVNQFMKSSDGIGINPVLITPQMVGTTIGQFDAVETKKGGWDYSDTDREAAQLNFGNYVMSLGGRFRFSTYLGDAK